jgi:palmitoyltransferase
MLSPLLILVPLNMYIQYYLVTHVPPGYPSPRALALNSKGPVVDKKEKWLAHDPKSLWAPERWGMRKRGGERLLTGSTTGGLASEGRRVKRCRKCDGPKPEVRTSVLAYLY